MTFDIPGMIRVQTARNLLDQIATCGCELLGILGFAIAYTNMTLFRNLNEPNALRHLRLRAVYNEFCSHVMP